MATCGPAVNLRPISNTPATCCGPLLSRPGQTLQPGRPGSRAARELVCLRPAQRRVHQWVPPHRRIHVRFWFICVTQRTPSSQRPHHVRASTGHRVPFAVRTQGSHAVDSSGRPVRSVPWAYGPSESINTCSRHPRQWLTVSSLSQRKAHRPLVSQTRTPESYPSRPLLCRLGPVLQTCQPADPGAHDVRVPGNTHSWDRARSSVLWAGARSPLWRRRGPGSGSASGGPGGAVEDARPGRGPGWQ
jgi:hypothetical protein